MKKKNVATGKQSLSQRFNSVKKLFFPQWDRAGCWKVSSRNNLSHGFCDRERKLICINYELSDDDSNDALMIHEICHAIASPGHGSTWKKRMERAAAKAVSINRPLLAETIRNDVSGYSETSMGRNEVYQVIESWIMATPTLTLNQVKQAITFQYGIPASGIAKEFKKLESVYKRTIKDVNDRNAKIARIRGNTR